jgi:hypothetical protein
LSRLRLVSISTSLAPVLARDYPVIMAINHSQRRGDPATTCWQT